MSQIFILLSLCLQITTLRLGITALNHFPKNKKTEIGASAYSHISVCHLQNVGYRWKWKGHREFGENDFSKGNEMFFGVLILKTSHLFFLVSQKVWTPARQTLRPDTRMLCGYRLLVATWWWKEKKATFQTGRYRTETIAHCLRSCKDARGRTRRSLLKPPRLIACTCADRICYYQTNITKYLIHTAVQQEAHPPSHLKRWKMTKETAEREINLLLSPVWGGIGFEGKIMLLKENSGAPHPVCSSCCHKRRVFFHHMWHMWHVAQWRS